MMFEERVPLSTLTTFKTGGYARYLARVQSIDALQDAVRSAKELQVPLYVLGEGSNVLPPDKGYEGVVIAMEMHDAAYTGDSDIACRLGAGMSWDSVVRHAATQGWWGIENLAGIPGTCGAAPIQNIGAYGTELSHILQSVQVYNTQEDIVVSLTKDECGLGYRDSVFKSRRELIVTEITLTLTTRGEPCLTYPELKARAAQGADVSSPSHVGAEVRAIRARKFPNIQTCGTAGSFFKNPIIEESTYQSLKERYPGLPGYAHEGKIKIPLAYILDHILSLKGYRHGSARLFESQPLVLVLDAGGTSADVETLALDIARRVHDATGISIEREVQCMSE